MPIYEYECQKCGHTLEALQKFSDKPLRECPECGKHQLKRLVSAPMFRLAGSGWYETDFKSDKERKRNLQEQGDKEPQAASDDKAAKSEKTETKVETKTDSKSDTAAAPKSRTMVAKPARAAASKPKAAAKKSSSGRARKR
jgi:putative FmdB family regulatory protein